MGGRETIALRVQVRERERERERGTGEGGSGGEGERHARGVTPLRSTRVSGKRGAVLSERGKRNGNPNSVYLYRRCYRATPGPCWASAFTEAGLIAVRLQKWFYGGGLFKKAASKIFGGGCLKTAASLNHFFEAGKKCPSQ
jgi:hypothetical protein